MRNNESGEFELVVGNRQLLSGFFIVVLLFAVAFAMGYVVGQNSRSVKVQTEASSGPPPVALTPADRPQPLPPAPPPPAPAPESGTSAAIDPAASDTAAAQAGNSPAESLPATQAPSPELAPGSYWQVMAVAHTEADVVLEALKVKGFPTVLTPGPNNLVRVLVGPFNDTQSMGKAKTDLENAGFRPWRWK